MRKCPPGTCSANVSNVKLGNTTLHWQCFKCIFFREDNFPRKCSVTYDIHDIQTSRYPWHLNIHDVRISMVSEYPGCPNIHDVQVCMMSKYPWCPNILDVRISMMSEYPWRSNIHDVQISKMSKYPWYSNIHDVRISLMSKYPYPIYETRLCLMRQMMKGRTTDDDDGEWNAPVDPTASLQVKIQGCQVAIE